MAATVSGVADWPRMAVATSPGRIWVLAKISTETTSKVTMPSARRRAMSLSTVSRSDGRSPGRPIHALAAVADRPAWGHASRVGSGGQAGKASAQLGSGVDAEDDAVGLDAPVHRRAVEVP